MLDLLATSIEPSPEESREGATGRGAPAAAAVPAPIVVDELLEMPARLASVEPLAGLFLPQPSAAAILLPIVMLALGAQ